MTLVEFAEVVAGRMPPAVRRRVFRVGYRALQAWWMLRRPHTAGVKVVVRRGDDVLLVRHTYGRSRVEWDLPGGFINAGEDPQDAVLRELSEEVGLRAQRPVALGAVVQRSSGRRDTVHGFAAEADGDALAIDEGEISQARWFARDALPDPTTPYTRRMVARAYWDMFRQ